MSARLCDKFVGSLSVTVVGTSLVINIPEANFNDCDTFCLAVLQTVPVTATRGMPVVITIGTDATQYQIIRCDGRPVTQEYIGQGYIYKIKVLTTTTSAVFKMTNSLCGVSVNIPSVPVGG